LQETTLGAAQQAEALTLPMLAGLGWLHEQEASQSEVKKFMLLDSTSDARLYRKNAAKDIFNFSKKKLMRSSQLSFAHKCILSYGRHTHDTIHNRCRIQKK